ncbi:heavy-metal-associated domain-containing protein [Weissella koreensis]|uniref:heavy-metal-associated domain-containing protein n=1 Tax=Weissella koreensis TaxID=165096 RepID=UPI0022BA5005|nr:heavy-metal-associated domain-containing protein [Weissella koreensis]MCZ9311712.1 heavy-metal-associated domain-containing protein [Weissella koreensis]
MANIKVTMQLDDLSCPSCMIKIQKALAGQSGLSDIKVLFNASKIKLNLDDTLNDVDQIKIILNHLGYPVHRVTVKE